MAFGVTSSPLYIWLLFLRRILLFELMKVTEPQVLFPIEPEIADYVAAISTKHPILIGVWNVVNRIKGICWSFYHKNVFYNCWTHGHYISSIYMFAPDGWIRICSLNITGCLHDSHQSE